MFPVSVLPSQPRMCIAPLAFSRIGAYDTGVHAVPTLALSLSRRSNFGPSSGVFHSFSFPVVHYMIVGQVVDYSLESFYFGYAAIEGVTMYSVDLNRSTSDIRDLPLFFYSIISIHVFSSLCGFVYTALDDVSRTPRFRSPSKFQPSLSFRVLDWLLLLGCFANAK